MRGVKLVTYLAAKLFGGEVSVRQLAGVRHCGSAEMGALGAIQCGFGTSRRCNGYKRQGAQ